MLAAAVLLKIAFLDALPVTERILLWCVFLVFQLAPDPINEIHEAAPEALNLDRLVEPPALLGVMRAQLLLELLYLAVKPLPFLLVLTKERSPLRRHLGPLLSNKGHRLNIFRHGFLKERGCLALGSNCWLGWLSGRSLLINLRTILEEGEVLGLAVELFLSAFGFAAHEDLFICWGLATSFSLHV